MLKHCKNIYILQVGQLIQLWLMIFLKNVLCEIDERQNDGVQKSVLRVDVEL